MRVQFLIITAVILLTGCRSDGPRSSAMTMRASGSAGGGADARHPIVVPSLTEAEAATRPWIYVAREVNKRGIYAWADGLTLTDLIASAGGLTPFAGSRIRVFHEGETEPEAYEYDDIVEGRSEDPLLRPGDRVWVLGSLL